MEQKPIGHRGPDQDQIVENLGPIWTDRSPDMEFYGSLID